MRADRLLSLLLLLQDRGKVKADELAARLEVTPRTIHRDVQALSTAGVPVYAERGPAGGIGLLGAYRTEVTGLSREEAAALVAAGVPRVLSEIGLGRALRTGLVKLEASLPNVQRLAGEHLRRRLHVDVAPWFHVPEEVAHLEAVRQAVLEDRELHLRYRARGGEPFDDTVKPLGLVAKAESWYLVVARRSTRKVLRVSRILEARLGERFARPSDFDLQSFWERWARQFETTRTGYPVTLGVAAGAEDEAADALGERARVLLRRAKADRRGEKTIVLDFEKEVYAISSLAARAGIVRVLRPARLKRSLVRLADDLHARYRARGGSARAVRGRISPGGAPRSAPREWRGGPAGTTPRGPRPPAAGRRSRR
jgi:predicted DNA-binding transcriptional regulator YafY